MKCTQKKARRQPSFFEIPKLQSNSNTPEANKAHAQEVKEICARNLKKSEKHVKDMQALQRKNGGYK